MDGNLTEIIIIYIFRLLSFGLLAFYYFCFRGAITDNLIRRKKLTLHQIYDLKKGMKNYWFLESIHKEVNLGIWYTTNQIFVVSYLILFIPLYFTGYIIAVGNLITFFSLFLYPFALVFYMFWTIEDHLRLYKKVFILYRRDPGNGKLDSFLVDLMGCATILLNFYAQIKSLFP